MTDPLPALEAALGHRFGDRARLLEAITHRSFAHESKDTQATHNERLEFLGDAVLGLVVSGMLVEAFPSAREGELTRRRADLVCEASLAEAGRRLGLGEVLRMGRGEAQTGGREKPRLLACALEACVGAAYLDGGLDAARAVVRAALGERLAATEPGADDHKSKLQERLQAAGEPPPTYAVVETGGPDHARTFRVEVRLASGARAEGAGRSKTEAEQAAAAAALSALAAGAPAVRDP